MRESRRSHKYVEPTKAGPPGSNLDFAHTDPLFRKACESAGIKPTKRQASKWRNKRGLAYLHRHNAAALLLEEEARV